MVHLVLVILFFLLFLLLLLVLVLLLLLVCRRRRRGRRRRRLLFLLKQAAYESGIRVSRQRAQCATPSTCWAHVAVAGLASEATSPWRARRGAVLSYSRPCSSLAAPSPHVKPTLELQRRLRVGPLTRR